MSEMVERVARAISREAASNKELIDLVVRHGDTQIVHINAAVARALARAAITEMHEPTEEMKSIGYTTANANLGDPILAWRAMNDAALKEDQ